MKSRARAAALTVVVFALAAASLSALRGQQQSAHPPKEQQAEGDPLPVVEYSDRDDEKELKRQAKGRRYDGGGVQKKSWEGGRFGTTLFSDWEVGLSALPAESSDAVILGTVQDARAYLSPDKTGVYSEFDVKVDEVLKDSTNLISVGGLVAADREGGRVRYPSGEIVPYTISAQGVLRVNKRYILFLKGGEDGFRIVTGYELRGGKARALDFVAKFEKFNGTDEATLLRLIREAIASASSSVPEPRR